jgi:hypothetical protein
LLFYAPVLVVCGVCILLAFHRAGVVSGCRPRTQIGAYILVGICASGALYGLGSLIRKHAPDLAQDIAEAVVTKLRTDRNSEKKTAPQTLTTTATLEVKPAPRPQQNADIERLKNAEKVERNLNLWLLARIRMRKEDEEKARDLNKSLDRDPEFGVNGVYHAWWPETLLYYQQNYAADVIRLRHEMLDVVPEVGAESKNLDLQNPPNSSDLVGIQYEFKQLTAAYRKRLEDLGKVPTPHPAP